MLPIASAAAFIAFLDVTVVNVALPEIGRGLGNPDVTELSWTVTAYGAAFAALLTPAGRIADVSATRGSWGQAWSCSCSPPRPARRLRASSF